MSIEADARHQLKMPQYGADKDSLIGNTSDNGSADNVEDVDDGEEDITKNMQQQIVHLEHGIFPLYWHVLQKSKAFAGRSAFEVLIMMIRGQKKRNLESLGGCCM